MFKRKICLAMILVLCLVIITACAQEEDLFKVGVIPALTEGDFEEPMKRLQQVLDEALPQKVEVTVYPDYNGVVEALNFGHIQFAYLGPSTYVIANHRSGAQAIITHLIDGQPYYNSLIITRVDAPWNTLEDLIGQVGEVDFAFGDINSTSGSLVPSLELKERGIFTDQYDHKFKSVRYTGSHNATGSAIENKHVHAGAIDSAYFNSLVNQGHLDGTKFKTLWTSEPLYQYPWAVGSAVDQETITRLQAAFVAIDDQVILQGFGSTGFLEASDEDYDPIRQVMIQTGKLE
jgi:phosphonate transport system substrate-binding protein